MREEPFDPVLLADFYPDDAPFKALTQAIKNSCRTFELFEIARLILEKPERWVCVARHREQKEGEPPMLHATVKEGLPFLSEQAALNHVFAHSLGDFFEIERFEGEPPAGSFQLVHRCGMTGELLAPPNYHRYQAIVRDHHASRLAQVPFERFQQRIESVREPEAIQAWLDKMKQRERYTLKAEHVPEGQQAPVFEQIEDARLYLSSQLRDKLVRPAYSVRFVGRDLQLLPEGDLLRRSVEALHDYQLRFPLETANNLRGRLRRLNFAVYKRGAKGVSYVCAVKRRFRRPGEVLAENLSDLIAFVEAHPDLKAQDLPREYLGVVPETPKEATAEEAAVEEGQAAPSLSPEQEQVLVLRRELRYLVTQGYIVEYSDGRLSATPERDESGSGAKAPEQRPAGKTKGSDRAKTARARKPLEASPPAPEPTAAEEAPTVEAEQVAPGEPEPQAEAPDPVEESQPEASEEAEREPQSEPDPETKSSNG